MALAEAFRVKDSAEAILFAGTDSSFERSTLSKKGFAHVSISIEGLKGRGWLQQVRSLAKLPKGFWQSLGIIWRFNPDIIVGVGGYASGPVTLAARLLGKKVVIHEQNFVPGLTNRVLARFAHRVFISFPDELSIFKTSKTVVTGNPVRQELISARAGKKSSAGFAVLIVGGSQGAHAINCAVVDCLDHLKGPLKMSFIHQTGPKDAGWVRGAYAKRGMQARVEPFFEDMASAYGSADLVVCRAGATTVAELTALGKPAIYIPFPFAANNHQEFNARYVADCGGGELILEKELDGPTLASRIDYFASHAETLQDMSARASALGRPDAADVIVDECQRLVVISH
jgi:UDP-N-acetylglucosamine--N-acetylmuramyl-(pentapeptide) pyrophosphoryl-undecaprenol N-acetylglucosamine transferase